VRLALILRLLLVIGGYEMTRARYGLLAGIAGAAFGAWWWKRRGAAGSPATPQTRQRGEVIFRNTPEPTGLGGGPS
jgi:hypothetical protein